MQAMISPLRRPSHLRKSHPLLASVSSNTDLMISEAQTSKKVITNMTRATGVWPIQGGLQTITNTAMSRSQAATLAQGQAAPAIKTETVATTQEVRQAKTPSPKKAAMVVGKENVNSTTPQSAE